MGMVCDHIHGTVGDPSPDDGGQPSSDWWVAKYFMVGDQPGDGWWLGDPYLRIYGCLERHISQIFLVWYPYLRIYALIFEQVCGPISW